MNRFTKEAKWVLTKAYTEATQTSQKYIQPHHILLSLVQLNEIGGGIAYDALLLIGIGPNRIRDAISLIEERRIDLNDTSELSKDTEKMLENTIEEAIRLGSLDQIAPEHLLLGIVDTTGGAQNIFELLNTDPKAIKKLVLQLMKERD